MIRESVDFQERCIMEEEDKKLAERAEILLKEKERGYVLVYRLGGRNRPQQPSLSTCPIQPLKLERRSLAVFISAEQKATASPLRFLYYQLPRQRDMDSDPRCLLAAGPHQSRPTCATTYHPQRELL